MNIPVRKLLDILLSKKVITQEEHDSLELAIVKENIPIENYLLHNTKISKSIILEAIGEIFHIHSVDISSIPISPQALSLISQNVAMKYILIPFDLDEKNNLIKIAMKDPLDMQTIEFLEKKTNKRVKPFLSFEEDIKKIINTYYSQTLSPDVLEALKNIQSTKIKTIKADRLTDIIKEAPIAKIVSTILEYAIKGRASDIHIEPQENRTRVRYRIDGILHEKLSLPKSIHDSLVSRIKILSELKIDEKRIPQDGRFNFKIASDEVDLRVSTLPTVHGEKVVMRLLKKTGGIPTLQELGFTGPQLHLLETAISKPNGIILVTGPTGSGKSTTLYSVLNMLNKPGVNIVTLEDPVEYQVPGINQVQTNPQAGLTFATGLRSFLRQDPNIILIGEIRDSETTQLAIQAALTGHLVFSTLHTNDAATSIPRLIDLGAEPFLIASVLNATMAQRICRRICPLCKTQYEAPEEIKNNIKTVLGDLIKPYLKDNDKIILFKGEGCSECNNTGYFGRIAIFEIIQISQTINKMILSHQSAKDIENQAKEEGLITMKQDGYIKALAGITTIEEVLRVAEV